MSKVRKPTGRVVTAEDGSRSWVWHGDSETDTAQVRALGEGLSLDSTPSGQAAPTLDPYNQSAIRKKDAKRRSLDDMRRLSEQIKNAKRWKRED